MKLGILNSMYGYHPAVSPNELDSKGAWLSECSNVTHTFKYRG